MATKRVPTLQDPIKREACAATFKLAKPTDIEGSFDEPERARWMWFARKGIGRELWTWKCPACKPQGKNDTR